MEKNNTIQLLQECDSGTKMAVSSIDEVLKDVKDAKLREILQESKEQHENFGNEIHEMLNKQHAEGKEPTPIAKGMSWMKTNMKLSMEESDKTVADLITDGCNMGIKSLLRYKNEYKDADVSAVKMADRLVKIEEKLREAMRQYL